MWISTQDDGFVNCDNIYTLSIRKNVEGWEIYADSVYDKRVKLGVYRENRKMEMVLDGFGNAIVNGDKVYIMPLDSGPFSWDEIEEMNMKGSQNG